MKTLLCCKPVPRNSLPNEVGIERIHVSRGLQWHFAATLVTLTVTALTVGCQTPGIQANRLPARYRQARDQHQTLNFAGVSTTGTSEAIIAPRDLLKVTIVTNSDREDATPIQGRVSDDGMMDVPIVGPVPVAGMEVFEASENIKSFAIQRGMYKHPIVTVEIEKKAVNRVTVLGAVKEPGVHELPRGSCSLLSALAASGGMTDEAGTEVEIVRQPRFGLAAADSESQQGDFGSEKTSEIQLAGYQGTQRPNRQQRPQWSASQTMRVNLAERGQMESTQFQLSDRDIVRVIPRKKEIIHVGGLVHDPGQFELPFDQDLRLVDAIALAGGRSSPVADNITIIRQPRDEKEPIVIQASLSRAKEDGLENLRLVAGDTITIEQTPTTAVVDAFSRFFRLSLGVATNTIF